MGKARGGLLALVAALVTAIFYGRAYYFDLQCDDLPWIRPWSGAELAAVWHGGWDPSGAFAVFFRPISTWFYAGTFEFFGFNAPAHMLLSLVMLALVMWLLSLFIARESGSAGAGVLAAFLYAMHPNVPWSTGTWVTNDFHKLTAISALCALLVWQRVRNKPWSGWLLLAPFAVFCFLVKEDGLMLIPALVSIQWARAKLVRDVKAPNLALLASAGTFAILLFVWRYLALRELGGFDLPRTVYDVFANVVRGPLYAFTLHGSLSVLTIFEKLAAVVIAILVAFGIATMPREKRFLPIAGLLLMFWYDLPLSLISNVMRYYMLTIASVMVIVPVLLSLMGPASTKWRRPPIAAGLMMVLLFMQTGAQGRELKLFAPCGWAEHNCVSWVLEEVKMLPLEARAYVADTPRACRVHGEQRPHLGATGTLTWGLGETTIDTVTGERSNLVTGRVVALIRSGAGTAAVAVRHPEASLANPVRLRLATNGQLSSTELTTPEWKTIEVTLEGGWRVWLRGAHRIDATFSASGAQWKLLR